MKFVFVFAFMMFVGSAFAASAVRFVGTDLYGCGSASVIRFNKTANVGECFSFTNPVNGTEACTEFYVLRDADTLKFDRYADSACQSFKSTDTFSTTSLNCIIFMPGVTESCSGANSFRPTVVEGASCEPNCVAATTSSAVSVDLSWVAAITGLGVVAVMFL